MISLFPTADLVTDGGRSPTCFGTPLEQIFTVVGVHVGFISSVSFLVSPVFFLLSLV